MKKSELRKIIRQVIKEQFRPRNNRRGFDGSKYINNDPLIQNPFPDEPIAGSMGVESGGIDFSSYEAFARSLGNDPWAALQQAGVPIQTLRRLDMRMKRETGESLRGGMMNERIWGAIKWLWKNRREIIGFATGYYAGS